MKEDMRDFTPPPPDGDDPRTPFQKFENLARKLFSVPKQEIDEVAAKDSRGPKGTPKQGE